MMKFILSIFVASIVLLAWGIKLAASTLDQRFATATKQEVGLCPMSPVERMRSSQPRINPQTRPHEKIRTFVAKVTAYTSSRDETDDTPCTAANGDDICALLKRGDRSCAGRYPFGTRLDIPGIGVCTIRDRTAARYNDRIDVYFGGSDKKKEAKQWGAPTLTVKIIK